MSAKARYYLEQAVPEIDDLVTHNVFSKPEVSLIMKKRTDFEHRLNSRGSSVSDYLRYAEYESNVEKLRLKRVKRLQIAMGHSISTWSIQQRIVFIYQRAVNKFPRDITLWSIYLGHLKSSHASYKKIHQVYNQLLKLHPANVDVWISAAKYEYESHANFKSARALFQNGLRFNCDAEKLWFEYVKFELNFVTKLLNRRKVLGLVSEREMDADRDADATADADSGDQVEMDADADTPVSASVSAGASASAFRDQLNELPEADVNMLGTAETNPALRGDVALAVFDVAMKKLQEYYVKKHQGFATSKQDLAALDRDIQDRLMDYLYGLCLQYIELFEPFSDMDRMYLVNHVVAWMKEKFVSVDKLAHAIFLDTTLSIRFVSVADESFVEMLQLSYNKYVAYQGKLSADLAKALRAEYAEYLTERNKTTQGRAHAIIEVIIRKL